MSQSLCFIGEGWGGMSGGQQHLTDSRENPSQCTHEVAVGLLRKYIREHAVEEVRVKAHGADKCSSHTDANGQLQADREHGEHPVKQKSDGRQGRVDDANPMSPLDWKGPVWEHHGLSPAISHRSLGQGET